MHWYNQYSFTYLSTLTLRAGPSQDLCDLQVETKLNDQLKLMQYTTQFYSHKILLFDNEHGLKPNCETEDLTNVNSLKSRQTLVKVWAYK